MSSMTKSSDAKTAKSSRNGDISSAKAKQAESNTSTTHSDQNGDDAIVTTSGTVGLVKKELDHISFAQIFEDDFLFETLLDFFSLDDIYTTFSCLNRLYQQKVEEANYLLLRKLTDKLHISPTYLTSDLPCHSRVVDVYKSAVRRIEEGKPVDLKPNSFTTDSGLVSPNMWYSMHNIFEAASSQYSYYVFSSNKGENNHIQAYLCNPSSYDNTFAQKLKREYEKAPGSKTIYVPYEKYPLEGGLPTFKVPKIFEMNCRNQGFCYYADNIALFFSEDEVEHDKFNKSTKYFSSFKSVAQVKDESKMPILSIDDSQKGFTVIEFDLSKKKEMMKAMGINKFHSLPLVYINLDKNVAFGKTLKYEIKQNVAAKYMSMKLIC